jgi:hypothetical protein
MKIQMMTILAAIVLVAVIFTGAYLLMTIPSDEEGGEDVGTLYTYNRGYVQFDLYSLYASGQDAEADWDIDVFEIGDESIDDLYQKGILDCKGVTPLTIVPGQSSVKLSKEDVKYSSNKLCKPNVKELMQDTTAGDIETKIDDAKGIIRRSAHDDRDDKDGTNTVVELDVGSTYLVVAQDSDENDFYVVAFLVEYPEKGVFDAVEVVKSTGGQYYRFDIPMYARAASKSELDVVGECTDDQGNNGYSADDGGIVSDQLTTNTTSVEIKCTFDVAIMDSGVALIMENPFTGGDETDEAAIQVDPYGLNDTGADTIHDLIADGDDYGTSAGNSYWSMYVQGKEIVSTSTQDCYTDNAGEKLRCVSDNLKSGLCVNAYDENSKARIYFDLKNIYSVDVDETDDGTFPTLSDGELIADLEVYEPASSTDIYAGLPRATPEVVG